MVLHLASGQRQRREERVGCPPGHLFPNDNRIVSNETFKAWADDEPYLKIRIVALKKKGSA